METRHVTISTQVECVLYEHAFSLLGICHNTAIHAQMLRKCFIMKAGYFMTVMHINTPTFQ